MTLKHFTTLLFTTLSLVALASCGNGSSSSSAIDAQETTTVTTTVTSITPKETTNTTTTPTNTTTTAAETTTIIETTTTTAETTTTTTTVKEYDRSYYSFNEQKQVKLKYNTVLYYAPDRASDGLYNFDAGTILIAIGETSDFFAVTMNNEIVFCEKVAADYYVEPVYTEAIPVVDEPEPTFVITD